LAREGHTENLRADVDSCGREDVRVKKQTFFSLQAMRALAAVMVVLHHSCWLWYEQLQKPSSTHYWTQGSAGVDIFFVLSGFIIPSSMYREDGTLRTGFEFLARRLERVVPLYWLFTTIKVLLFLMQPAYSVAKTIGSPFHIAASYLFLPSWDQEGNVAPLLPVGWTLSLEMGFYAMAALALWINRRRPFFLLALFLLLLAPFPQFLPVRLAGLFSRSYMFVEFLLGLLLWGLFRSGRRMSVPFATFSLCASMVYLMVGPVYFALQNSFVAAMLVASALSLETTLGAKLPLWLVYLGDASYSIYLIHWHMMKPAKILVMHSSFPGIGSTIGAMLLLSLTVGTFCYRFVEQPMNSYFKVRRLKVSVPG